MKEDRPLLPGRIEGLFQLLDASDYTEAALCVGVLERRQHRWWHLGHRRLAAGGQLQQRLGSLRRQVVGQSKQAVFVGLAHVVEPLRRDAVAQQLVVPTIRVGPRAAGGLLQVAEDLAARHRVGSRLAEPDRRFHSLHLAEERADPAERMVAPVVEQTRRFRRHLPLRGWQIPPGLYVQAHLVDARG